MKRDQLLEQWMTASPFVTHFKQTGDFNKLPNTLKQVSKKLQRGKFRLKNLDAHLQESESRWNTKYFMIDSIVCQYSAVQDMEIERRNSNLSTVDMPGPLPLLKELLRFLKPFMDATEALSFTSKPTLHLYVQWYCILEVALTTEPPEEHEAVTALRKHCLMFLKKKMTPTMLHKAAMFLNPDTKDLVVFSEPERQEVHDFVRGQLPPKNSQLPEVPCPSSSGKYDFSKFKFKVGDVDEMTSYTIQPPNQKADQCPVEYWFNQPHLPALSAFCKRLFAIPATSTPSERLFSRAKFIAK